jgi:hypothetical protein
MSFTSLTFFACLLAAGAAFYMVAPKWRAGYLLALSYAFYLVNSQIYLLLLIATTAGAYVAALRIAATPDEGRKKLMMAAAVVSIIGLVVFYKLAGVLHGVLLPLGIHITRSNWSATWSRSIGTTRR